VRLLAPTLEVELDGRPMELRDMTAKLLLTLLLAQPSPVHIERALDVLWPDADAETGRRRLNTVVYRLRQALALDVRALRRSGDVLILDTATWDVDLPGFRRALRSGGDEAAEALAAARGNLAHVQFPYDELFVDERRALAAEAARAIREITRAADEPPEGLEELLRVLDPDGSLAAADGGLSW
jgi:DNA-binding SARP family transcriptional activator